MCWEGRRSHWSVLVIAGEYLLVIFFFLLLFAVDAMVACMHAHYCRPMRPSQLFPSKQARGLFVTVTMIPIRQAAGGPLCLDPLGLSLLVVCGGMGMVTA